MQYYQIVLPFPLDTESCHFPTNMGERRGTTACYFLVPSFPQGMRLEQQLHIFVAPVGISLWPPVLHLSPIQGTAHICHRQVMCSGHKNEIQAGKAFLWWGWSNSGTVWPVSLWSLHPLRNWKPSWHCSEQPAAAALSRGWAGYSPGMPSCLNWSVSFA